MRTTTQHSASLPTDDALPEGSRWRRLLTWTRQTTAFAIAVSLFVHVALILTAAVVIIRGQPGGADDGAGEVPLAVIAESELTELLEIGLSDAVPTTSDLGAEEIFVEEFDEAVPETDLSMLEMTDLGEVGGAGEVSGEEGAGAVFGGASGAASFFGVEARGSRFAYIIDVSGSMEGERLSMLKRELNGSVVALLEHTHFSVVLYNSDAYPLTGDVWRPATEQFKRIARRDISAIRARGGTNPLPAFELAFAMKPRPDAIYFMTDGVFSEGSGDAIVRRIMRLNNQGRSRTPIHCITFIEKNSEEIMTRLAQVSGGTYAHVDQGGR